MAIDSCPTTLLPAKTTIGKRYHQLKLSSVKYYVTKLRFYNNKTGKQTYNNQKDYNNMKPVATVDLLHLPFVVCLLKLYFYFTYTFCIAYLKALQLCMPIIYNILMAFEISQQH